MRFVRMPALAFAAALAFAPAAAATERAPVPDADAAASRHRQGVEDLERLKAEQTAATEAQAKLDREIQSLRADRRRLSEALVGAAAGIRRLEERIAGLETRLAGYAARESALRGSLVDRQDRIADLLAVLQRIGRQPPPALFVHPGDAVAQLRAAIAVGSLVPDLKAEAEILARDLTELSALRLSTENDRAELDLALQEMERDRTRLTALTGERQRRQTEAEEAQRAERARIARLARESETLRDLVQRLEREVGAARRAADAAARADAEAAARAAEEQARAIVAPPPAAPADPAQVTAFLANPARMTPAQPFVKARGTLSLPVNGVRLRNFGAADTHGGSERGLSIATRPGADVTSPADGWIVYAGPFRSYGHVLIVNAGGGYHILLAGLDRISVEAGQFVVAGEPVARMGSGTVNMAGSGMAPGAGQPVLYIEFRKDGSPVDPTPWWTQTEQEKIR
jgi:septal ring factor EnvC (AmiA/AmiB activator)